MTASLLANEFRLLWRHGFVAAYAAVTIVYAALASTLPPAWSELALTILAWSDPVFFSFFFVGASVCLDLSQGTFRVLFAGPVRPAQYVAAKGGALALLSLASTLAIAFAARGMAFRAAPLALAAVAGCVLTGAAGMALAISLGTVSRFIIGAVPVLIVLALPILSLSPLARLPVLRIAVDLHPATAVLGLCGAAFAAPGAVTLPGPLAWTSFLVCSAAILGPILGSLLGKGGRA